MCIFNTHHSLLLAFDMMREIEKGHNLYKPRMLLEVAHLHLPDILIATVSLEQLWKSATRAVAPFTLLQEYAGDTASALAFHLSHHSNSIQNKQHCELTRIQPKHIPLPLCVFYFSFKINSFFLQGQIPASCCVGENERPKAIKYLFKLQNTFGAFQATLSAWSHRQETKVPV